MDNNNWSNSLSDKKQPNILILMVDQERSPTVYETKQLKEWRTSRRTWSDQLLPRPSTFLGTCHVINITK